MNYEFYEFNMVEYKKRLDGLRSVMKEKDLDAVILTEEDNIRWLTGYWVFTMQDGGMNTVAIVPLSDEIEPCLLLTAEGTGEDLSWVKDIQYWEEDYSSYMEADKGKVLFDTLKKKVRKIKRIGMELSSGMKINMDQNDIDFFRDSMSDAEIMDIAGDILRLRSIKSNAEIEKLRKASDITCQSMVRGFSEMKEGMTERKLGQKLGKYFFEYGATGISHIGVGFGKFAIKFAHSDPKEYPLKSGMLVKVDSGCRFEGYRCDMYRMACLGEPEKEEERVALTIAEANEEIVKNIRGGIKCSRLYEIALDVFEDKGFSHLLSPSHYIGHGIGLGTHEPPYIYKNSEDILFEGMVLSIEPWTYDPEKPEHSMNIEDVVLVTKNGAELLTPMEKGIFRI